jgi:hypothetical protein
MSEENRDSNTGQFTPSTDNTSGEDHANLKAGYVPLKEPGDEKDYTELKPQEAADRIAAMREEATPSGPESAIVTYSPLDELIGENTALTNKQLSHLIADHRKSAEEQIEAAEIEATRKEVDELRGEDQEIEAQEPEPISDTDDPDEAVKRLPPKLREAVAAHVGETETARVQYLNAVNAATEIVKANILGKYPVLSRVMALPPEQQGAAIQSLIQNEPGLAAEVAADLQHTQSLFDEQRVASQQDAEARERRYQEYAKAESAKFEATIKDVPRAERAAIEQNIAEAITEYGGDLNQFLALMRSSEFASSTVQSLLWEVGKYRQIQKAPKSYPFRNVPPVQRPGTAGPRVSHSDMSVADAKAAVHSDRSTKSLAGLIGAMRRA